MKRPLSHEVCVLPPATCIVAGLWQGGQVLPDDLRPFALIVNATPFLDHVLGFKGTYVQWPVNDGTFEELDKDALRGIVTLVEHYVRCGRDVLVHCQAGLNRSGLICGLALRRFGLSGEESVAKLREQRSEWALCNAEFERAVLEAS